MGTAVEEVKKEQVMKLELHSPRLGYECVTQQEPEPLIEPV